MKTNLDLSETERDERLELLQACKAQPRAKNARLFSDVCAEIVKDSQCMRFKGSLIDLWSAGHANSVFKALKQESRDKLNEIASKSPSAAMGIVWKLIKKAVK